jgi:hypothetical protein
VVVAGCSVAHEMFEEITRLGAWHLYCLIFCLPCIDDMHKLDEAQIMKMRLTHSSICYRRAVILIAASGAKAQLPDSGKAYIFDRSWNIRDL